MAGKAEKAMDGGVDQMEAVIGWEHGIKMR